MLNQAVFPNRPPGLDQAQTGFTHRISGHLALLAIEGVVSYDDELPSASTSVAVALTITAPDRIFRLVTARAFHSSSTSPSDQTTFVPYSGCA